VCVSAAVYASQTVWKRWPHEVELMMMTCSVCWGRTWDQFLSFCSFTYVFQIMSQPYVQPFIGNYNRSGSINRSVGPPTAFHEEIAQLERQNELQRQRNLNKLPNDSELPQFSYEERTGQPKPELPDLTSTVSFDVDRPLPPRFRAGIGAFLPKQEHVLYRTSSAVHGSRGATEQEMLSKYYSRSNKFSNSFSGHHFRDNGLNTSTRVQSLSFEARKKYNESKNSER
jgi:hypothetical protein